MNPRSDSLFRDWLETVHKPHLQRVRRAQRHHHKQRGYGATGAWYSFADYPAEPAPRYPYRPESAPAPTSLKTYDPKVR